MPQSHGVEQNLYEQFVAVRKTLSEATASFWSDLEIYKYINEAQEIIQRKAKLLKKTVTVTTVLNAQEYNLRRNGFSDIMDISDNGILFKANGNNYIDLDFTTKKQLSLDVPGWRNVPAAIPQEYYYDKGSKTIGLYPKPNTLNAGAYLDIEGYYFAPILHAGTVASATVSTLVLAAGSATVQYPSATNDYYNGLYVQIYSGTGAGQKVEITDYVASTRTISAAFDTAPDSTSIYGMVSPLPAEAHPLMPIYALGMLLPKGGSRRNLGKDYMAQFFDGLKAFMTEAEDEPDQTIIRDIYR